MPLRLFNLDSTASTTPPPNPLTCEDHEILKISSSEDVYLSPQFSLIVQGPCVSLGKADETQSFVSLIQTHLSSAMFWDRPLCTFNFQCSGIHSLRGALSAEGPRCDAGNVPGARASRAASLLVRLGGPLLPQCVVGRRLSAPFCPVCSQSFLSTLRPHPQLSRLRRQRPCLPGRGLVLGLQACLFSL